MTKWGEKPYHSLDYMLRERFGEKVYKVTLNGGMSCPNRDGKIARSVSFHRNVRFINILPISRRTQIPTHLWNIWKKFLQKQSLIQR